MNSQPHFQKKGEKQLEQPASIGWTENQNRRLNELNADSRILGLRFQDESQRSRHYRQLEKRLVNKNRQRLSDYRIRRKRPALCRLENRLVSELLALDFVQVSTPIIMARGLLQKMSIDTQHPLCSQIFWIDNNKCLRPMLAPHLYYVLVDLLRLWERPVRIFEIGPCFRKESKGALHAEEFTMLNLVEMGLPQEDRETRIQHLGTCLLNAVGIERYRFETVPSEIYGETIDITVDDGRLEIGSAAMGPHPLDRPWHIHESWIGIGFGLERMLMASLHTSNLSKTARSLAYIDGIRLNI
jgi:pyrrolysyl-tRNA synthetase-like protein